MDPDNIINIRDLQILKVHAKSQDYDVRTYLRAGHKVGLDLNDLIHCAYKNKTIEQMLKQRSRRRMFKKISYAVSGIAVAYAINFAVMFGMANYSTSPDFHNDINKIQRLNSQLEALAEVDNKSNSFDPRRTVIAYTSAGLYVGNQTEIEEHNRKMEKAVNPVLHLCDLF